MKVEWDFSGLTEFAARIQDAYDYETALMTATQNIARVLHNHLLRHTPVRTGNLRKMWSAGDNLAFMVTPTPEGFEVTLINEARADNENGFMYGVAVNDGLPSRNIIGRFFVEKSVVTAEKQVERIIMRELRKWWERA